MGEDIQIGEEVMDSGVKVTILEIYKSENKEDIALVDDGVNCYPINASELEKIIS